jgi:hypothetical protein
MTLAIGLVNPEGIVMAADSRQSYRHAAVRVGSDSAIKVFALTDTVVAATSGYAFLRRQNAASAQNISTLVEDLKPTLAPTSTVLQVATALHAHFSTILRATHRARPRRSPFRWEYRDPVHRGGLRSGVSRRGAI